MVNERFVSSVWRMLIHDTNSAQNITSISSTNERTAGRLSAKVCTCKNTDLTAGSITVSEMGSYYTA